MTSKSGSSQRLYGKPTTSLNENTIHSEIMQRIKLPSINPLVAATTFLKGVMEEKKEEKMCIAIYYIYVLYTTYYF